MAAGYSAAEMKRIMGQLDYGKLKGTGVFDRISVGLRIGICLTHVVCYNY